MLKTIERATGQPIAVEKLPTVADLRTRRLELTRAALRESLLEDDLETFRAVVEPLGEEFGLFEVALAAVKLAHETSGTAGEEEELPEVELRLPDDRRGRRKATGRDQRRGRPATAGTTPVRGDRTCLRSPATGSGRRFHRRVVPLRQGHRGDRDRRSILARRGPRVGRRRGGRGAPADQYQGPEGNRPPRTLPGAVVRRCGRPAGTR